jgi:transposase
MARIRTVKTASGASAVQVVKYYNNRRKILKHFGSAHNEKDLNDLISYAEDWIKDYTGQLSLFGDDNPNSVLYIDKCSFLGVFYTFFYDQMSYLQNLFGFKGLAHTLLDDLVIIRILEPASKLRSIELLHQYFGIQATRQTFYKLAPKWLEIKKQTQDKTIEVAKKYYNFDYSLLFYDVTTLYFESFTEDNLKENGFSKDGKSQQPQILVALIVTKEGFPVAYEIFSGSTFEGHTLIPSIKNFIKDNNVELMTIVADAAMISAENIAELRRDKINYIVGARLGNLAKDTLELIDKSLQRQDGKTIRINTESGYLICSFSSKRQRKDEFEMKKQIEKAKSIISSPSKAKKVKFTTSKNNSMELNEKLILKTKMLLGIKGYYTDLDSCKLSDEQIIDKYLQLYKVEHAFRISKHDLQTRPIFHNKEEPIKLHILICYMALALSRHIELQTGASINKFINEAKKVVDARMLNHITGKELRIRAQPSQFMLDLLSKLNAPH